MLRVEQHVTRPNDLINSDLIARVWYTGISAKSSSRTLYFGQTFHYPLHSLEPSIRNVCSFSRLRGVCRMFLDVTI